MWTLPGKMQGYRMERECSALDIQTVECMLRMLPAPEEIILPLLAFTFLTPLNHFLKLAGCEPKFVLFLVGKTGSRKSTLAALFLSFFGRFTGAELPLSFRDTANSILHNAFTLKDVLSKNQLHDFVPNNCIGYEDEIFFYLHSEIAHKAVKKLCEEQGESFSVSSKGLLKALAEEKLIETCAGQNTKAVRIGGKSKRVACLYKEKAKRIVDAAL